jgi:muramoyltetrapeptide carboxypeptidase
MGSAAAEFLRPKAVPDGAVIGIVAPASPVRAEFVERGVVELEKLGFRPRLGANLYRRGRYTAGSVDERLEDLLGLWESPEVDALLAARGGYGSLDLIPRLDRERLRVRPKVIVGASDVTALLSTLGAWGIVSFHGPMLAQRIARNDFDADGLLRLIQSPEPAGRLDFSGAEPLHPGRGRGEGVLHGGCLSLVTALVGTPYLPSWDGSVLFLEDTGVKPYQIDRMLTQLRLSGRLDGVRGIVFGQMPGCEQHPDQGYTLPEMLREWTAPLGVPVWFGFPSGHTLGPARTLPFGVRARLDDEGLEILEGAVS